VGFSIIVAGMTSLMGVKKCAFVGGLVAVLPPAIVNWAAHKGAF
jgi:hypothetical protein